jgi:hypothetical protein
MRRSKPGFSGSIRVNINGLPHLEQGGRRLLTNLNSRGSITVGSSQRSCGENSESIPHVIRTANQNSPICPRDPRSVLRTPPPEAALTTSSSPSQSAHRVPHPNDHDGAGGNPDEREDDGEGVSQGHSNGSDSTLFSQSDLSKTDQS